MIKWVARLAFVTVLLALIGTFAIITHMPQKQDDKKIDQKEQLTDLSKTNVDSLLQIEAKQESVNVAIDTTPELKDNISRDEELQKKFLKEPPKQDTLLTQLNVKPIAIDAGNTMPSVPKTKEAKKEVLLNDRELLRIFSKIYVTKVTNNIKGNCVHLFITKNSNRPRTLKQVERYLTRKNYTIAGRDKTSKLVKGIKILPASNCVSVIIGNF